MPIQFFSEDITFKIKNTGAIKEWVLAIIKEHNYTPEAINYILCSDEYLKDINKEYLNHDYYTDIITFDNSEKEGTVEADIFISIDRIKENALVQTTSLESEFHRVIIHGILHLIGYDDKTKVEKILMREKEDSCLSLLKI